MRFGRLDLNLLVALDALLTEQNVSVAADRVCIGQSAMSGALNRLREYFDDELLVIKGRRMVLTPRAESLVEPVRNVLLQIKTTITTKPTFDPATCDREISLLASDYTISVLLSESIAEITKLAPDMRFTLSLLGDHPAERLERGEVDLLITLDHAVSPSHPCEPLFEDDYVVVACADNTALGDRIDQTTYFDLGHVSVLFGKTKMPAFEEWFLQTLKAKRRVEVLAPSFSAVPDLIVGTNRIATMHRRLAVKAARHAALKILPVPIDIPDIREVVQWHRSNSDDAALRWVVDQIHSHADASAHELTAKAASRALAA
jgi:LysR family nod box-dependent transcriptional activator